METDQGSFWRKWPNPKVPPGLGERAARGTEAVCWERARGGRAAPKDQSLGDLYERALAVLRLTASAFIF